MKVLVVSSTFPPMKSGGAEYAFRLCQHLAEAKLDVHVLVSKIQGVVADSRIKVYPVMRRWTWSELPRLLRVVSRTSPDVVNVHFTGEIYHNQPMVTFLPSILKRLYPGLSVVALIEYPKGANLNLVPLSTRLVRKGIAWWIGSNNIDWGFGTLLRDSDRLVVLSDQHRQILQDHFPVASKKCVLIPPPPLLHMCKEDDGLARQRGRELLGLGPGAFVIAYYGFIYPGKGIETLMESVRLLNERGCAAYLVLVGGSNEVVLRSLNRQSYLEELQNLSELLGIASKVKFTGYYPSESDRGSLFLRASDACVLPFDDGVMLSRSSFAAAAVHGLPTVTTRGTILESPFIDRKNVLLCRPKDPKSLADSIYLLIHDSQLRQRLHDGILELAHEWFSWERTLNRMIEVFSQSIIDSRRSKSMVVQ